ncbi:putative membrane protein [Peptoniphilus sp. oral taxon 375 str. F0436]|nr:putative membrane protein [Peptoniphilus sp. oral taxon 375 str. F0436]
MKPIKSKSLLPMILQSIGIGIIGILFPIAYVFLPMLFLTEAIDKGLVKIMGTFVGLCLLLEALVPRMGMVLFTLFGPLILILHYCLVTKKDLVTSLTLSSGLFVVSILVVLETTGVLAFIQKDDFPQKFIEMQKKAGIWQDSMTQYIPTFESMMRQMVQYLPAILIILSLIVTYVTLTFTGRKLLLRGKLVVQPPSFFYFRLPQGVFAVLGTVILVGLVFQTQMDEFAPLLANNGLVLTAFLFFIQGLAVVDFFFLKLRMFRLLKAILLTMIIFTPLMQVPVACLGLLDSLLNLRRIHLK